MQTWHILVNVFMTLLFFGLAILCFMLAFIAASGDEEKAGRGFGLAGLFGMAGIALVWKLPANMVGLIWLAVVVYAIGIWMYWSHVVESKEDVDEDVEYF